MPTATLPSVSTRIALLVNPTAGQERSEIASGTVLDFLHSAGYNITRLAGDSAEDNARLAQQAVDSEYDILAVSGGDGTVNAAIQAVVGSDTVLAIVPGGTSNDFARALGINLTDPYAAGNTIAAYQPRIVDLARVGDRYFATILATGTDTKVSQRANTQLGWLPSRLRYDIAAVAEWPRLEPTHYDLELDGEKISQTAMLVAVANGPMYGGGIKMAKGASMSDGLLDVIVIDELNKAEAVSLFTQLRFGTHLSSKHVTRHQAKHVTVTAEGVEGLADGESFGELPLTVDIVPQALRVLAPPYEAPENEHAQEEYQEATGAMPVVTDSTVG